MLLQVVMVEGLQVVLGNSITPGEASPMKHIRAWAEPSMPRKIWRQNGLKG